MACSDLGMFPPTACEDCLLKAEEEDMDENTVAEAEADTEDDEPCLSFSA